MLCLLTVRLCLTYCELDFERHAALLELLLAILRVRRGADISVCR